MSIGEITTLDQLLVSLFDAGELRRFIRNLPNGAQLSADLPDRGASLTSLAFAARELLARHGLDNADLLARLVRARPHRRVLIEQVWEQDPGLCHAQSHRSRGKRDALRRQLAEDMTTWGQRCVFGNARTQKPHDLLPFHTPLLTIDNSYVEPDGACDNEQRPILALLRQQSQKHPIVVIKADFGYGKSLTARCLARDYARDWLTEPALEPMYPVFIRCARDIRYHSRDGRYHHDEVVRRALWNHAKELFHPSSMRDTMFAPPADAQAAVFVFDGLDEVVLTADQLEDLFASLREALGPGQRAVIFTRPGVLTSQLAKEALLIELMPFSDAQVETWIAHWNQISARTVGNLSDPRLAELSKTPILLFMIAVTWQEQAQRASQTPLVDLYEQFVRHIARGKYGAPGKSGDTDEHTRIRAAAQELAERLNQLTILTTADPMEAMLWLMARVAWEAHYRKYELSDMVTARHVHQLLQDELGIDNNNTMSCIPIGLLLTMQLDPTGAATTILFGHQSFREFLVARYWRDHLVALICKQRNQHESIETCLMKSRLLHPGDGAFGFLLDMLRSIDEGQRQQIKQWAQDCFLDERLPANAMRTDRRAYLRETALAIGSCIVPGHGLDVNDPLVLRSLWIYYEFHETQPRIVAPGLRHRDCRLRHANLSRADLRNADLSRADLRNADLHHANLSSANLSSANLHNANLRDVNLRDADLSVAQIVSATLRRADLRFANLNFANLNFTDLRDTDLRCADLRNGDLRRADLRNANLRGADLRHADLRRADLRNADLRGADLRHADLRNVTISHTIDLCGVKYNDSTVWPAGFDPGARGGEKIASDTA